MDLLNKKVCIISAGIDENPLYITEEIRAKWDLIRKNLSIDNIDGEKWRPIYEYENSYLISNFLRVKSIERIIYEKNGKRLCRKLITEKILEQYKNEEKYWEVRLSKDSKRQNKRIHRLYAQAFIPNPEGKQVVNHKNLVRSDNIPWNLEWNTPAENNKHAQLNGAKKCGEEVRSAKITKDQALEIYNSKESYSALQRKYNLTKRAIYLIRAGKSWKSITGGTPNYNKTSYPKEMVIALYKSDKTVPELSNEYRISRSVIYRIKNKQTYKEIIYGLN